MSQVPALCSVLLVGLLALPEPAPPPFAIDLTVQAGKVNKTVHAAKAPQDFALGHKPAARPVLEVKAGSAVTVRWSLTRSTGQAALKSVLVHAFVAPEEKLGQTAVPRKDKDNPVESALVMDFRPGGKAEGEVTFTPDRPGAYLLRLETIGAATTDGRESFAALDLVVR
jgi:hypothetical protein